MCAPAFVADAGGPASAGMWVVWLLAGGVMGALAARLSELGRIGSAGYVVSGALGGLFGGLVLGALGVNLDDLVWSIVVGLAGALFLLLILNAARGDRGMGGASGH